MQKLSTAQALVSFLKQQKIERDGLVRPFFAGMWGIFGHGNVAGLGQALEENKDFTYYQARNEQGMVHAATAFAKQMRRLQTFACTSSIGPGATNMLTGAATASINRIPVLLLPGDSFARRTPGPVLQQLENPHLPEQTVNDCFKPVSKYWDRINRPEQLLYSLPAAVKTLTDPAATGAVTISLPQDVQAEAGFFPDEFFEPLIHIIPRPRPDVEVLQKAKDMILKAQKPLIVAGGGVIYSEAEKILADFCTFSKIPVCETQAGKGSLSWKQQQCLGAVGVTGNSAANLVAKEADLIIAIGTRLSDFTTASGTQFENPNKKFINVNISAHDSHKYSSLGIQCDARVFLEMLLSELQEEWNLDHSYAAKIQLLKDEWNKTRADIIECRSAVPNQATVIESLNNCLQAEDTVVGAAGSLPGDLHKLLNVESGSQYHMEYGYSCMGYEIAGGLGVKMAHLANKNTKGEVFVLLGDGSYLMLHTEILTAIQEQQKLIVLLLDNSKFACIDRLAKSCGSHGFGNEFRLRNQEQSQLSGEFLHVDYQKNAESYGIDALTVSNIKDLDKALKRARESKNGSVIVIKSDPEHAIPSFNTRWEVVVAEVAKSQKVNDSRREYEKNFKSENR